MKEKVDLEKAPGSLYYTTATSRKKLLSTLVIESVLSILIYHHYDNISTYNALLAPALLGMSTAALAQSINQYFKRKLSLSRIAKFMVWGMINGCFTVMWFDLLIKKIDNLLVRVAVDQLVGSPLFQLIFNVLNAIWDHGELNHNFPSAYINSLKYSYCFWPFFSAGSFVFLPQAMMFPANCAANLVWNIILSKLS